MMLDLRCFRWLAIATFALLLTACNNTALNRSKDAVAGPGQSPVQAGASSDNAVRAERISGKRLIALKVVDQSDQRIILQLLDDMRVIPAGQFRMGDIQGAGEDDESPVQSIDIASFAMARYELTFEQYGVYARATGNDIPETRWGQGRRPVIRVSWHDAMEFIDWLNGISGLRFRLPSEAEWEYAARAGSEENYAHGNNVELLCNYANIADSMTTMGWRTDKCRDGFETTAPVGSFKANGFGLYDMHGNVWEWLADCWNRNHSGVPLDGQPRTKFGGCSTRVQRSGSWFYGPEEARLSYRSQGNEFDKSVTLGFRLAQDI